MHLLERLYGNVVLSLMLPYHVVRTKKVGSSVFEVGVVVMYCWLFNFFGKSTCVVFEFKAVLRYSERRNDCHLTLSSLKA